MQTAYSSRINAALRIAARAHARQVRKGTDIPYVTHPVHVSFILARHGLREEVVIAGLLHDTLEDTSITKDELRDCFGDEVLALVCAVTEQKTNDGIERPWEVRKAEQLAHLATASNDVVALKCADALHNASETLEDIRAHGAELAFRRFKRGAEPSILYYAQIAAIAAQRLGADHPLGSELRATVDELARAAGVDVQPAYSVAVDRGV